MMGPTHLHKVQHSTKPRRKQPHAKGTDMYEKIGFITSSKPTVTVRITALNRPVLNDSNLGPRRCAPSTKRCPESESSCLPPYPVWDHIMRRLPNGSEVTR